jgi:hypothetical protein
MNMVRAAVLPGQSEQSGRNGHAQARPESRKRLSERHCPSGHNYDRYVRYVGPFAFAMRRAKQKPRLCTGRRFSAWVNRHRRRPPPAVCRPPAARRPPSAGCRLPAPGAMAARPSHPRLLTRLPLWHLPAEMPGAVGREKIHEKSQGKVVGGGGVRSSYIRRTRKRQGVGLTTEGRRGNARAGTSPGGRQDPRAGARGGSSPGPAGRPRGRKGTARCRDAAGGRRTGSRQMERDPAGPWLTTEGTAVRDRLENDKARAGSREGVHAKRPDRRLTGAVPGGNRAGRGSGRAGTGPGANRAGRGPGRAGTGPGGTGGKSRVGGRVGGRGRVTVPAPACHAPPFNRKDKGRKHQFHRPWKVFAGGNGEQCEPRRMTPRPRQPGLTPPK